MIYVESYTSQGLLAIYPNNFLVAKANVNALWIKNNILDYPNMLTLCRLFCNNNKLSQINVIINKLSHVHIIPIAC